jgi:hypothetical protein
MSSETTNPLKLAIRKAVGSVVGYVQAKKKKSDEVNEAKHQYKLAYVREHGQEPPKPESKFKVKPMRLQ